MKICNQINIIFYAIFLRLFSLNENDGPINTASIKRFKITFNTFIIYYLVIIILYLFVGFTTNK